MNASDAAELPPPCSRPPIPPSGGVVRRHAGWEGWPIAPRLPFHPDVEGLRALAIGLVLLAHARVAAVARAKVAPWLERRLPAVGAR